MKIVYAGTPDFAVEPLRKIIEEKYEVAGVICQPDKPQGRKGILTPPPVKKLAEEYGISVLQPEKIKNDVEEIKNLHADIMITCAYGQLLTQDILDIFPMGVWNIHASLLPLYRGASPIQSCVLNGEKVTGVTIMKTELGLDSGDILLSKSLEIGEKESYGELSERLALLGAEAIKKALVMLENGGYNLIKQDESKATLVRKIKKEDALIDFSQKTENIMHLILGMNPEPGAYGVVDSLRINIYNAEIVSRPEGAENAVDGEVLTDIPKKGFIVACSDGAIKITDLQAAGGKRMKGSDFLNGRKVKKGQVFSW